MQNTFSSIMPVFRYLRYHTDVVLKEIQVYRWRMEDTRFLVFRAVTTKNAIFWDVCRVAFAKNQRFGGEYRLHFQGDKNRRARNNVSSN
jgi:hypothetical protein